MDKAYQHLNMAKTLLKSLKEANERIIATDKKIENPDWLKIYARGSIEARTTVNKIIKMALKEIDEVLSLTKH
ncbi:MAG: hypothetical protein H0Z24_06940 [Thermosipho sp. (in: Bacteria)]|nr:hypothetical protein [Thermosipho sp. (in: thermotogales)]